jgi:hypothetical protein
MESKMIVRSGGLFGVGCLMVVSVVSMLLVSSNAEAKFVWFPYVGTFMNERCSTQATGDLCPLGHWATDLPEANSNHVYNKLFSQYDDNIIWNEGSMYYDMTSDITPAGRSWFGSGEDSSFDWTLTITSTHYTAQYVYVRMLNPDGTYINAETNWDYSNLDLIKTGISYVSGTPADNTLYWYPAAGYYFIKLTPSATVYVSGFDTTGGRQACFNAPAKCDGSNYNQYSQFYPTICVHGGYFDVSMSGNSSGRYRVGSGATTSDFTANKYPTFSQDYDNVGAVDVTSYSDNGVDDTIILEYDAQTESGGFVELHTEDPSVTDRFTYCAVVNAYGATDVIDIEVRDLSDNLIGSESVEMPKWSRFTFMPSQFFECTGYVDGYIKITGKAPVAVAVHGTCEKTQESHNGKAFRYTQTGVVEFVLE